MRTTALIWLCIVIAVAPPAAAVLTPQTVYLTPGMTVAIPAEFAPTLHGAAFQAGDGSIASVSGRLLPGEVRTEISVTGLREGTTPIVGLFPQGFSVWIIEVGMVVVSAEACVPAGVSLPVMWVRASAHQPVTLSANVTGSAPVQIEWLERTGDGEVMIAAEVNPVTIAAPGTGTRTIIVRASNACGSSVSEPAVIGESIERRRPARR